MKKIIFLSVLMPAAFLAFGRPSFAQTAQYQLLAPIPLNGANSAPSSVETPDLATYVPAVIKLVIGLATGIAVVLIVIGGFKYITSATGIGKTDGKDMIWNAIIGLLLTISAYTILNTINPNLVNFNFDTILPNENATQSQLTPGCPVTLNKDGTCPVSPTAK